MQHKFNVIKFIYINVMVALVAQGGFGKRFKNCESGPLILLPKSISGTSPLLCMNFLKDGIPLVSQGVWRNLGHFLPRYLGEGLIATGLSYSNYLTNISVLFIHYIDQCLIQAMLQVCVHAL